VPREVSELALHTVSHHGVPHGPADHEAETGRSVGRLGSQQVHHEGLAAAAPTAPRHLPQVVAAGDALRRRKHGREGTVEP
jgi:hypothetical protein